MDLWWLLWLALFAGGYMLIYFSADELLEHLQEYSAIKKVSPFIIGLFIIGIDPEETIASIIAAINGLPYIALGNVVGNSIISISLCFALPAFFYVLDFKPVNIFYPIIIIILSAVNMLATLGNVNLITIGVISIILFVLYVYRNFKHYEKTEELEIEYDSKLVESNESNESDESTEVSVAKESKESTESKMGSNKQARNHLLSGIFFLLILIIGGEMLVYGAEQLIMLTGIDEGLFGFIIIAFLTNVEEITLIVKSIRKNNVEIGIGGMIGKIIWNLGFTYGISSLILLGYAGTLTTKINGFILLVLAIHFLFILKNGKMGKKIAYVYMSVFCIFILSNILTAFLS